MFFESSLQRLDEEEKDGQCLYQSPGTIVREHGMGGNKGALGL